MGQQGKRFVSFSESQSQVARRGWKLAQSHSKAEALSWSHTSSYPHSQSGTDPNASPHRNPPLCLGNVPQQQHGRESAGPAAKADPRPYWEVISSTPPWQGCAWSSGRVGLLPTLTTSQKQSGTRQPPCQHLHPLEKGALPQA